MPSTVAAQVAQALWVGPNFESRREENYRLWNLELGYYSTSPEDVPWARRKKIPMFPASRVYVYYYIGEGFAHGFTDGEFVIKCMQLLDGPCLWRERTGGNAVLLLWQNLVDSWLRKDWWRFDLDSSKAGR